MEQVQLPEKLYLENLYFIICISIFVIGFIHAISVHVIFDDAFELNDDVDKFVPNSFVKQLMECMEDAARYCIIIGIQSIRYATSSSPFT